MLAQEPATDPLDSAPGGSRLPLVVAGAAAALIVAAGGLLWLRLGGAVFNDYLTAGLAWCF